MTPYPSSHEPTSTEAQTFIAEMQRGDVARATVDLDSSQRIQFWSTFQSTIDIPFPSVATGREVDDIAAVTAGSKPATILMAEDFLDPMIDGFMTQQKDRIKLLSTSQAVDHYGGTKYFLGHEENVRILADLYQGRGGGDSPLPADENFHRAVGEALGYPKEAVDAFIAQIASLEEHAQQKGRFSRLKL